MRTVVLFGAVVVGWLIAACDSGSVSSPTDPTIDDVSTTTVPITTATTTAPTTTTTVPVGLPLAAQGAPVYELVFSIPTGAGGVTIEGGTDEILLSGPAAFSVAPDGSVWVADTGGLRLLRFDPNGTLLAEIFTDSDAVGPIFDVAGIDGGVWGWESVPALGRDRLVRYSTEGRLEEEHELPPGLGLFDGLSGIWADDAGDPWVELLGGGRVFRAFGDSGEFDPIEVDGYDIDGVIVALADEMVPQLARINVGGTVLEAPVRQVGGFSFEGAVTGAVALRLEDVGTGLGGVFDVDISVWWVDRSGTVLATAGYERGDDDAYFQMNDFVAVSPDGRLFAMVPRTDGVDIVILNAFAVDSRDRVSVPDPGRYIPRLQRLGAGAETWLASGTARRIGS